MTVRKKKAFKIVGEILKRTETSSIMGKITKFLILLVLAKAAGAIQLNNGGYEDVYIFVQDTTEENGLLLERIQEVFTEASQLMFTATRQKIYFKKIKIVIPRSWSSKPEYKRSPVPSPFKQYIVVDNDSIKTPHVRGLDKCGGEGIYMFLSAKHFLLKKGKTNWGLHDHVVVHEWAHLRWGIFDEYPMDGSGFYQADGLWKPVSCPGITKGRVIKGKCTEIKEHCDKDDIRKMMDAHCRFCPEITQSLNISLMSHPYLNEVSMFCDKNDRSVDKSQWHNRRAPNMQNLFCEHKSAWEVMRTHKDFQDDAGLSASTNTTPEFDIIQGLESFRVFVLDVSGSMKGTKLTYLQKTGEYIIQEVIMEGSWLGIVTFSTSATTAQELTQVNSQSDRDDLKSALPTSTGDSTCIGCGIKEAIRILKLKLGHAEDTEIIVISDGLNNVGNLQTSIQEAVHEKVIVHTIAVSQEADRLLANISQETGGKHYAYLQTGTISFAASFSETITGDLTSAKSQHVMLLSEKIYLNESSLATFNFTIDDGVGGNTSVTVITEIDQDIDILLVGPSNYSQSFNTHGTYATLLVPDVATVGHYTVTITTQRSRQAIEYLVKSIPTKEDIVRMKSWLSTNNITLQSDDLPIAYVDVRKGFSPVLDADVKVHVENEERDCVLALADNGKDPDVTPDDGLYAGYLMPECLGKRRVNVKGYVSGKAGKTSSINKVFGAPAITEDDEAPEVFHKPFQRVQVFEDLYISSSYNNGSEDTISPGRITDVNIYNIESKLTRYGESRNFTISWTAPGDDKTIGQASTYIFRISDNLETLLRDFDSADLLEMNNVSFSPQKAGMTEALKIIVDAEQTFTKNTFFAIKAVDEAGNLGKVSNIVPMVVANGYRATAEKGSLKREETTPVIIEQPDEDRIKLGVILGAVFGAIAFVLIIFVAVFIKRKKQMKGDNDVRLDKV